MDSILLQALSCYGLENARTLLLQGLWHHVYFVETEEGERFNLRICAAGYKDKDSLADELTWLEYVAQESRLLVPRPVPNLQGEPLTILSTPEGDRFSCLFVWIEGEAAKQPLILPVIYEIGRTVATLHQVARNFAFPTDENGFRRNYCYDRNLAASHREWVDLHREEIGSASVAVLHSAIDWLIAGLDGIGETPENYGFIHADLHLGNFLVNDGHVSVIDFDQLGRGHYLYDIATLWVELSADAEHFPERWDSFKKGYQMVAELPFSHEDELDIFIVAVHLAFLDWVYNSREPAVRTLKMPLVPASLDSIRKLARSTRVGS